MRPIVKAAGLICILAHHYSIVKIKKLFCTATAFTFEAKPKSDQKGYREITWAQERL
jgi:hypothetical protein